MDHPVWNVYVSLRTVSLNVKYYTRRIFFFERINLWLELIIAITTSTAIAKFTIWGTATGSFIWSIIGGLAVLLSVLKPLLRFSDRIKKIECVLTKYRLIKQEYQILKIDISEKKCYNQEHQQVFRDLLKKESQLIEVVPENYISNRLRTKCQREVIKEYPVDNFYIPKE